jgi:nucleoside-diphosphate-sugar epimerase
VLRGDPTKLADATGWQPTIPLEQTLSETLAQYTATTA